MFSTAILEYPEFIAVALVALFMLKGNSEETSSPSFLRTLGLSVLALFSQKYQTWVAQAHNWSGRRSNSAIGEFAARKLLLGIAPLFSAFFIPIYFSLLLSVVAYFVPDLFLFAAMRKRQQAIRDALPQALDLMVLCVDAGLALDATVQRVSNDPSSVTEALSEELGTLGRDILLGMERSRAYFELYKRTGVEELKMLGSALNQSTKMGLSIGRILRSQSEFLRSRQTQKAEEKAAKLPVWISFPLWFCIMPALLFVIMGPSLITFIMNMGHVKPDWFN